MFRKLDIFYRYANTSMMMVMVMVMMMMMMIKNIRIDRTISGWAASVDLAKRPTPELQLSVDELHNN